EFQKYPMPFATYKKGFDLVQTHLRRGDSFLTNLTYPTPITTNLTFRQILEHSTAKYKLLFKEQFVAFSPETFIKMKAGRIASFPMKGTIDADLPNARQLLLGDKKERAEHNTIIDLIRNDLSQVATQVRVERFRFLQKIKSLNGQLLQMSSKISGKLPHDYRQNIGTMLSKLLPAGSISGAPKPKTVEIIKAAEGYERGFYTGIFGYYANGKLESGVLIRFIEHLNDEELVYKSGGGITVFSEAKAEYEEMIKKVYVPIDRKYQHKTWKTPAPELAHSTHP
ncbi:MAG: aminodeoxychorismate synthase component I, partial [Bacteroidota bacterium]